MGDWVKVCTTYELLPGERAVAWDGDTAILVLNIDGELYAIEDRCTHDEYPLSDGVLHGTQIECVLHGARYDLRDGSPQCAPAHTPVAKFPVRVEGDTVWTRDDRE
jgi:3-phenylpropionate/trans-cinnamate dioxygenase ferredoxin subunit